MSPKPDDQQQESSWSGNTQNFAEGAFRGLAAALRGYLQGKVLARQAKDDRESRFAQANLENKRLAVEREKGLLTNALGQRQLDETSSLNARLTTLEEKKEDTRAGEVKDDRTHEEKMLADTYRLMLKRDENQARLNALLADKSKDNEIEIMELQAQIDEDNKLIDAKNTILKLEKEGEEDRKTTTTTAAVTGEEDRKTAVVTGAEDRKTQGVVNQGALDVQESENQGALKVQEAKDAAALKQEIMTQSAASESGILTDQQSIRMGKVVDDFTKEESYKIFKKINTAYTSLIPGYWVQNGVGDLDLLNSFQRMIDPGVSVREGDVAIMQLAQSMLGKIELAQNRILEGDILSPELRDRLMRLSTLLYNAHYHGYIDSLKETYTDRLKIEGLSGKVSFEYLGGRHKEDTRTLTDFKELAAKYNAEISEEDKKLKLLPKEGRTYLHGDDFTPDFDKKFDQIVADREEPDTESGADNATNKPTPSTATTEPDDDDEGITVDVNFAAQKIYDRVKAGKPGDTFEKVMAELKTALYQNIKTPLKATQYINEITAAYNALVEADKEAEAKE